MLFYWLPCVLFESRGCVNDWVFTVVLMDHRWIDPISTALMNHFLMIQPSVNYWLKIWSVFYFCASKPAIARDIMFWDSPSVPFLWTRKLKNTLRECLQKHPLGLKNELIRFWSHCDLSKLHFGYYSGHDSYDKILHKCLKEQNYEIMKWYIQKVSFTMTS